MNTTNQTIDAVANDVGTQTTNTILNIDWISPITDFINGIIGTNFTTEQIGFMTPIISILLIYWKWNAIMSFLHTSGQTILLLVIVFLGAKAFGVF